MAAAATDLGRPALQPPKRISAAASGVTRGPKLVMFARVAVWWREIWTAGRTSLSTVVWPSSTRITG
jgi:hypothetical protein